MDLGTLDGRDTVLSNIDTMSAISDLGREEVRRCHLRFNVKKEKKEKYALAGNRTRAPRVAGEDSTTEPPVLPI